jgi:hypothetical protein
MGGWSGRGIGRIQAGTGMGVGMWGCRSGDAPTSAPGRENGPKMLEFVGRAIARRGAGGGRGKSRAFARPTGGGLRLAQFIPSFMAT